MAEGHRAGEVIQRIRQLVSKGVPRKGPVDINTVVRDILPLVRSELRHHDVSLTLRLTDDLPPVRDDRVQLQQVVLNLVMNAVQAMASVSDRPRELAIRSWPLSDDEVLIRVQDTGIGIAADHLSELFSAFFTTKPGGMCMGLSICRSIVEAHGGAMWATPNAPYGSMFQLSLPVAR